MRRLLPQTLPGWVLLVVIAGLLAGQVATLYIVALDRASSSDVINYYRLNERAFAAVQLMQHMQPDERRQVASGMSNSKYALAVADRPAVASSIAQDDELAELEDILVGRLSRFGITQARVRRDPASMADRAERARAPDTDIGEVESDLLEFAAGFARSDKLTASIQFADGQWLNFTEPIIPPEPVLSVASVPLYVMAAGLIAAMAAWSLRRLTAPYRTMERAVRRIGEDLKSPPLTETGSREIRAAVHAVNAMQARLRAYVEDREHLAAALAHDLRTPLTRMRLRVELLRNSGLRAALAADIADIEAIASSVIDLATFEVAEEKSERIDLTSLVEAVADGYPGVTLDEAGLNARELICVARPVALKRCIDNLVRNAVTYGRHARLTLGRAQGFALLSIRDEGPGIPLDRLEAVFSPFVRQETSRSRETGGLGLGLTIARNIARAAGGDIALSNHPEGGLLTELRLPLAS